MKKANEEIQKHISHIKEYIKHIIQTSEEEFEKSFNGSVAPSPNDYNKLRQCILDRIKPFQDQLVKYEQLKIEPYTIILKNDEKKDICEWGLVKESPYAEGEVIEKTLEDQSEQTQRKINELIK
jgi:hypothetical protein